METPLVETELEIIERHVRIAEKSYSDGKTPDEDNICNSCADGIKAEKHDC